MVTAMIRIPANSLIVVEARLARRYRQARRDLRRNARRREPLHHHHVEIALRRAAERAYPVVGNLGPARAGGESLFLGAGLFVVDKTAGPALPALVGLTAHLLVPLRRGS